MIYLTSKSRKVLEAIEVGNVRCKDIAMFIGDSSRNTNNELSKLRIQNVLSHTREEGYKLVDGAEYTIVDTLDSRTIGWMNKKERDTLSDVEVFKMNVPAEHLEYIKHQAKAGTKRTDIAKKLKMRKMDVIAIILQNGWGA